MALGMASHLLSFAAEDAPLYQNSSAPIEQRVEDLQGRLTLEEKVSLLEYTSPAIPRLGINEYNWWNEALHGVGRSGIATVFPQAIGMAAAWDDALLEKVFTAVSDEARAKNTNYRKHNQRNIYQGLSFWTPNINIFRDPRWGRGQETYGEDPYLTSQLGQAAVRGLQGPKSDYVKTLACAKHFAVHSGPEWSRHRFDAENIDPRDMQETYLPAFKDLVTKADVRQVMCAYNRYEGAPCCGSPYLLQGVLRDEWKYPHLVVSDCWALTDFHHPDRHAVDKTKEEAGARALLAGTDLECGSTYGGLLKAISEGLASEADVDKALRRNLTQRFALGEFDPDSLVEWTKIPLSVVGSKPHKDLALKIAQESMVLLKNDGVLPLKPGQRIALVGPNAADSMMQWGNYNGFPTHTVTLLEALKNRQPDIYYDQLCDHALTTRLVSTFGNCAIDGEKGFRATYWNNLDFDGEPVNVVQYDTPFHFTTNGATVFAPKVNLTGFSARYETVYTAPTNDTLTLAMQTRGAYSIYVDGQEVKKGKNMKNNKTYELPVEAGKTYNIRIDFQATKSDSATLFMDMGYHVPVDLANAVNGIDADVVIFAGGISPMLEGEEMPVTIPGFRGGDRENISLPQVQQDALRELKKAGKKVVFVNFSGSAMALDPSLYDAMVQAWYPGEQGGEAVAQVLMGDYNPSGRLPVTFYKETEEFPDFEDYSMRNRTYRYHQGEVDYPFGHGLSYSQFEYGEPVATGTLAEGIEVTVPITNLSDIDGEEVVQVYIRRNEDAAGPIKTLRGFKRVRMPAGADRQVSLHLSPDQLATYDPEEEALTPQPGTYTIFVGPSSADDKLKTVNIIL